MFGKTIVAAVVGLALAGCAGQDVTGTRPALRSDPTLSSSTHRAGAVYVMTNSPSENEVLAFGRAADGSLGEPLAFATGGFGTGAGLGSQGSLLLTDGGRWLLAVNSGSDDLSVFRVEQDGLLLTDRHPSGGSRPISVAAHGSLVYVLNAGGTSNIAGFRLSPQGDLAMIPGSSRPLSAASPGPAQVAFTPDGSMLVVTEKSTNLILTYDVGADGLASGPTAHPSAGITPFGFAFARRNTLVVSEAFGGAADASAASSYRLGQESVMPVSASVPTTETAACWAVATPNGRFVYVTNAGSGTVTGYAVGHDGALSRLDADGVTGATGPGSSPIDAAMSVSGGFLYAVNAGTQTISGFRLDSDGALTPIDGAADLPAGSVGLAAR